MEWVREREQWMASVRNVQKENSRLRLELQRAAKETEKLRHDHQRELVEHRRLVKKMDDELLRLTDEITLLNIEIGWLRERLKNREDGESWHTAPESP